MSKSLRWSLLQAERSCRVMIGGLPDAPPAVLDALRVAARRLGDAAEDLATSTERAESQPSLEGPLRASVGQWVDVGRCDRMYVETLPGRIDSISVAVQVDAAIGADPPDEAQSAAIAPTPRCSCGAPHPSLDPSNAAPSGLGIPLYDCPRCGSTCGPLEAP